MVCGSEDGREVYAVTHDIVPGKGWVMQFKVKDHDHPSHTYRKSSNSGLYSIKGRSLIMAGGAGRGQHGQIKTGLQYRPGQKTKGKKLLVPVIHR